MAAWRAKLGVLVPSGNSTLEPEFYKMIPKGVSVHFSRLNLRADIENEIERMTENMESEVQKLAHAEVDVIAFGCTGGSLLKGMGYDREIINRIKAVCNVPATTTSTAVINAMNSFSFKKISLATPYPEWLHKKVINFIEAHGIKVLSSKCLNMEKGMEKTSPMEVYRLVKFVDTPKSDGIFISCTDFPTIDILYELEMDLNKPVISSNQATLWEMLRIIRIRDRELLRWGSLFGRL